MTAKGKHEVGGLASRPATGWLVNKTVVSESSIHSFSNALDCHLLN